MSLAILLDEANRISNHADMSPPLLRELFGPSRDEIWRQLAGEINANYVDGDFLAQPRIRSIFGFCSIYLPKHWMSFAGWEQQEARRLNESAAGKIVAADVRRRLIVRNLPGIRLLTSAATALERFSDALLEYPFHRLLAGSNIVTPKRV